MTDSIPSAPSPGAVLDQLLEAARKSQPSNPSPILVLGWFGTDPKPMEMLISAAGEVVLSPLPKVEPVWIPCKVSTPLNLRYYPSVSAPRWGPALESDVLSYLRDVTVRDDRYEWRFVSGLGHYGWMASQFLLQINIGG